MESLLLKLARQLDSLDEASLASLWSKYAEITSRFEPTKRWEEACLVLSFITAKRMTKKIILYYIVAAIIITVGIILMNS